MRPVIGLIPLYDETKESYWMLPGYMKVLAVNGEIYNHLDIRHDNAVSGNYDYQTGSDYSVAGIASPDGRHLAMMPHLERAFFPWQNPLYPGRKHDVTPWMEAFVNARRWVEARTKA